jgi:hypothetical protein
MSLGTLAGALCAGAVVWLLLRWLIESAAVQCERCGGIYPAGRFCETCRRAQEDYSAREDQALQKLDAALSGESDELTPWRKYINERW